MVGTTEGPKIASLVKNKGIVGIGTPRRIEICASYLKILKNLGNLFCPGNSVLMPSPLSGRRQRVGFARYSGILQLNAVLASGQGQVSGRTKPGRTPVWLVEVPVTGQIRISQQSRHAFIGACLLDTLPASLNTLLIHTNNLFVPTRLSALVEAKETHKQDA